MDVGAAVVIGFAVDVGVVVGMGGAEPPVPVGNVSIGEPDGGAINPVEPPALWAPPNAGTAVVPPLSLAPILLPVLAEHPTAQSATTTSAIRVKALRSSISRQARST